MNHTWIKNLFFAAGIWTFLVSVPVMAGYDYKFDQRVNPMGNYEGEVTGKLTRGAVNTLFGWTEIAKTPIGMAQGPKKNFMKVFFAGVPYGVVKAAGRTGVGVFEMLTCYAPQKPILPPIEGDVV